MRWKVILTVMLILALVGVLFTTNFGKNYTDFLSRSIGKLTLPSSFNLPNFPSSAQSGEQFQIRLISNKNPYTGISFETENGKIISNGFCLTNVKINEIYVNTANAECEISLFNSLGTFKFTEEGSLKISANAATVSVGDTVLSGDLSVEAELIPFDLVLSDFRKDKLVLVDVDGEFQRIDGDGNIAQTNLLQGETITIYNFGGILILESSEADLQGFVSAVEGSTFKIPK